MKPAKSLILLFFCLTGFVFGRLSGPPPGNAPSRLPSSSPNEDEAAYGQLPCPTDDQFRSLAQEVRLRDMPERYICDDSPMGKLGKLLLYIESVNLELDERWKKTLVRELARPLEYIKKMTKETRLDLANTEGTAAYSDGRLELRAKFFSQHPLEGLLQLVHEARHGDPRDPGHTFCRYGDLGTSHGGCDQSLSENPETAGAYSYIVYYSAALARLGKNLSEAERTALQTHALTYLTNRFNIVPHDLAQLYDLIVGLDANNSLSVVHPFTGRAIPVVLPAGKLAASVKRIEPNFVNTAVIAFTEDMKVHEISLKGTVRGFYGSVIPKETAIEEAGRLRVLYEPDVTPTFATTNKEIQYITYDAQNSKHVLNKAVFDPHHLVIDVHRFTLAFMEESFYLAKDGQLYRGKRWSDDEQFFNFEEKLHVPGLKWNFLHGGLLFDGLFLISQNGDLYRGRFEFLPMNKDDIPMKKYSLESLSDGLTVPLSKHFEGINFKVFLTQAGKLAVSKYGENKLHEVLTSPPAQMRDFTVLRHAEFTRDLVPAHGADDFKRTCQLEMAKTDPWLGKGVGLGADGRLVFEGSAEEPCIVWSGPGHELRFSDFTFKTRPEKEATRYFSQSYIELTTKSGTLRKLELYGYLK